MKRLISFFIVVAIIAGFSCAYADDLVLKSGSRGDAVVKLQTRLIELGYLLMDAPDGNFGNMTRSAVAAYQEQLALKGYDIKADGVAGAKTLSYLNDQSLTIKAPAIAYGSKGYMVVQLQQILIDLNLLQGEADGVFGGMTKSSVEMLQQAMSDAGIEGARISGEVDEATLRVLKNLPASVKAILPGEFASSNPLSLTASNLYAQSCILIDGNTGEVLFEKNADEKRYPASTTKIMTLLLAVEKKKMKANVVIPQSAAEVPADSSLVPVTVGETMRLGDLLYGLMIRSGNDAANSVAEFVGGSVSGFVDMMNEKAAELGMTGTHFVNPHGYHDQNHYTTARDLGKLTFEAIKNRKIMIIVSAKAYVMPATEKRKEMTIKKDYGILDPSSEYYYPYAFGIKTGYTSIAGQCYVGGAQKDGEKLIAVVLHSGLQRSYKWIDAAALFNYGFAVLEQR